jgi:hypothetical protein
MGCRAADASSAELGPEPSRGATGPTDAALGWSDDPPASLSGTTSASPGSRAASTPGQIVSFEGTCDASGAIPLDRSHFAVADDEDNILRVYDAERGGAPLSSVELSDELSLERGAEADIEAATRVGDEAYFLTSHGRTRSGKVDPNRLLFFATTIPERSRAARVVGAPYRSLTRDLLRASSILPEEVQGALQHAQIELEGMTATPEGAVWIGFRSPVPEGHALLLRLANPGEVVRGAAPRLDRSLSLDLDGLGIRGLSSWRGSHLIIAGPAGDSGPFALYRWDGAEGTVRVQGSQLAGLGPEGFFSPEQREEIMLLSDDGTRLVDGIPCKRLDDPARKGFRGVWVRPQAS